MAKVTPKNDGSNERAPWENGSEEQAVGQDAPGARVEQLGQAAVPATTPGPGTDGWAVDDVPEVAEVDPRYRREQLARLAPKPAGNGGGFAVAVVGPATGRLLSALEAEARTIADDTSRVYEDIFTKIQNAETPEGIFADDDPLDVEDVLGVALQVWDFSVVKSDHTDGLTWYLAIKAVRQDTGEDVVVTCGAAKPTAQLMQAKAHKLLPVVVKFVKKERATTAGRHPLAMVLVK